MILETAGKIAEQLKTEMSPYCRQIEIAGSIRRGKREVKDIEICAIPKWSNSLPRELKIPRTLKKAVKESTGDFQLNLPSQWELFGTADNEKTDIPVETLAEQNLLFLWAYRQPFVRWIKPGVSEPVTWDVKPEGKYWRGIIDERIRLDLFLANADNWGVIFTIRTGSANFSAALMGFINKNTNYRVQKGHLTVGETGEIIPCPTEESFFSNAGIEFVPVEKRSRPDSHYPFRLNG